MDNLVPRKRMGGDKEPTKGNYTYLNHTLLSAEHPPPFPRPSAHMCARPALLCETLRAIPCVCVCFVFFCIGVRMRWGL